MLCLIGPSYPIRQILRCDAAIPLYYGMKNLTKHAATQYDENGFGYTPPFPLPVEAYTFS